MLIIIAMINNTLFRCKKATVIPETGLLQGAQDNKFVGSAVADLVGPQEPLVATVKRL